MIYKTLIKHKILVLMFLTLSIPVIANAERQPAELPGHVSKQLMSSMRGNLETLEKITHLLSESNYAEAADMAEKNLGMSSVEIHYQKFVGKYLPKGMRQISRQMHQASTDFALSAREAEKDGGLNKAFAALSQVMKQCVACHKLYKTK